MITIGGDNVIYENEDNREIKIKTKINEKRERDDNDDDKIPLMVCQEGNVTPKSMMRTVN